MPSRYIVDQDGVIVLPDAGPNSHRIQRFTLEGEFLEEWRHDVPDYLCGQDHEFDRLDCDDQAD